MKTSPVLAVSLLLCVAGAATALPQGWTELGRVAATKSVPVLLAVSHADGTDARLASKCMAVSDPASASYGQYMTQDQVRSFVSAGANVKTVLSWLASRGITDDSSNSTVQVGGTGDFVKFTAPCSVVEAMFGVRMSLYRVAPAGTDPVFVARTFDEPTMPATVAKAVDAVLGVAHTALPPRARSPLSSAARLVPIAGEGDFSGPANVIVVVGADRLYLYIIPASSGPSVASYELTMVVDTTTKHTVTFETKDLSTISLLGASMIAANTSQYIEKYSNYNFTMVAVAADGTRSTPVGLPYDWSTVPASWTGIPATPTLGPQDYKNWYGINDKLGGQGSVSVAEFGNQYYDNADLNAYLAKFGITGEPAVSVHGPAFPPTPGIEAQMDIELIIGVAPMVQSNFWLVEPNSNFEQGWILEFASQMSDSTSPPLVTSISYGMSEAALPETYYARCEAEFTKLCVRGLTVTVASGDAGASSKGHGGASCAIQPAYPASSSWITSVSATVQSNTAPSRAGGDAGEVAISISTGMFWTTGGGFSGIGSNRRPAYQAAAVEKYLASAPMPPTGTYNRTGRAYPDVSSIGTNYWITIGGETIPLGSGTSSASPTFAGVVGRLNEARLAAGKPSLGFINPLLYSLADSHPSVFYDVTVGGNKCGEYTCCPTGFVTAPGWDAVTGLGSVGDYELLKSLALAAAN